MKQEKIEDLIKDISQKFDKAKYPYLKPYNLTASQHKILLYLMDKPQDTIRQLDLQNAFKMTNPTITGILQNMEKNGWIERKRSPKDFRSKVINITDKVKKIRYEIIDIDKKVEKEMTENLTEEEKEELVRLLNKIIEGDYREKYKGLL